MEKVSRRNSEFPWSAWSAGCCARVVSSQDPKLQAPHTSLLPPTFILCISAFMARISIWPVSESTEARISFASWIFFSQSMIWCL